MKRKAYVAVITVFLLVFCSCDQQIGREESANGSATFSKASSRSSSKATSKISANTSSTTSVYEVDTKLPLPTLEQVANAFLTKDRDIVARATLMAYGGSFFDIASLEGVEFASYSLSESVKNGEYTETTLTLKVKSSTIKEITPGESIMLRIQRYGESEYTMRREYQNKMSQEQRAEINNSHNNILKYAGAFCVLGGYTSPEGKILISKKTLFRAEEFLFHTYVPDQVENFNYRPSVKEYNEWLGKVFYTEGCSAVDSGQYRTSIKADGSYDDFAFMAHGQVHPSLNLTGYQYSQSEKLHRVTFDLYADLICFLIAKTVTFEISDTAEGQIRFERLKVDYQTDRPIPVMGG